MHIYNYVIMTLVIIYEKKIMFLVLWIALSGVFSYQ